MKSFDLTLLVCVGLVSLLSPANASPQSLNLRDETVNYANTTGTFTWDSKNFYVNGKSYTIIGGQVLYIATPFLIQSG